MPLLEKLRIEHPHVDCLYVGIREVHPQERNTATGTLGKFNGRDGVDGPDGLWNIPQPKSIEERLERMQWWYKEYSKVCEDRNEPKMEVPWVSDTMEDDVDEAYNVYPFRIYVVQDGIVLYRGGHGPFAQSIAKVQSVIATNA